MTLNELKKQQATAVLKMTGKFKQYVPPVISCIKKAALFLFYAGFIIYSTIVGYWLFWPYNVIDVERPIQIMNEGKTVQAGDRLIYKIKYKKHMDIQGELNRKLINNYKIDLKDTLATAPIGPDCDKVAIEIPRNAEEGTYYLWWSVSYKVNPLRVITIQADSEPFRVVPAGITKRWR
jgi:hypothetical protein